MLVDDKQAREKMDVKNLLDRIDIAIDRITSGQAPMRVPVDICDPDIVLAQCQVAVESLSAQVAALTKELESAGATITALGAVPANWEFQLKAAEAQVAALLKFAEAEERRAFGPNMKSGIIRNCHAFLTGEAKDV